MAEVTINYKDAAIATMDASGTKTLQTQGKYCEDDIEVVYDRPSGGGGEWGSKWTEVTSAINVTNASGIAGAIFNAVLGPGTADHVHLGILRGKSKDNFPQYQVLLFERVGAISGNGSRYNSGATTMNGSSSTYDAAIEIGDTFMVTDLDYSV